MIFDARIMRLRHAKVNLNTGAKWYLERYGIADPCHFADPFNAHEMEEAYHRHLGLDWSYDGYNEDRSTFRRGSYLDAQQHYLHIGLDLNVNPGVKVYAVEDGEIVYQGTDYPLIGGWGYHVIQKIVYGGKPHALLYAHLSKKSYVPRRRFLSKGERLGSVGKTRHNGFWRPHVHMQLFADIDHVHEWEAFSHQIDGYAKLGEEDIWARKCPDPTRLVLG